MHYKKKRRKKYSCIIIREDCGYIKTLWLNLCLSFFVYVFFLFPESYFGDSFCTLQAFQDVSTFHLSLQIKTSRRSGLLLLAAGMEDYLFLELLNGKAQVNMWNESDRTQLYLIGKLNICFIKTQTQTEARQPRLVYWHGHKSWKSKS